MIVSTPANLVKASCYLTSEGEHSRLDSEHPDAIGTTDCGGTRLHHFGGRFGPLIMVDVVMMLMKVVVVTL